MTVPITIYPPLPAIEAMKSMAIGKINQITSARMIGGFDWIPPLSVLPPDTFPESPVAPTFHFSTDTNDQANFADASTKFLFALMTNDTGYRQPWQGWINDVQYTLTFDLSTYSGLGLRYAAHKNDTLGLGWVWKNTIRACNTKEEMMAAFRTFDITPEEIIAVNCEMLMEDNS